MKKLTLAIIGCGRVVEQFHLPALRHSEDWRIVGACDPSEARQRWAEKAMEGAPTYGSVEKLLAAQSPEAVLIATPPVSHAELATFFLRQGIAVLVEKPGAMNLKEAAKVAEAVEATETPFQVGFNRRFMDPYLTLKSKLRRSEKLKIKKFQGSLVITPEAWASTSGFLGDEQQGGGVFHDVAVHLLDTAGWLLGDQVEAVRCLSFRHIASTDHTLEFLVQLHSGVEIRMLAGHGQRYREEWVVHQSNRIHFLYPMGQATVPARAGAHVEGLARWRYWLERKFVRLGLMEDVFQGAARRQWAEFAGLVRGQDVAFLGAGANELMSLHRALEALQENCANDASWQSIGLLA